MGITHLDVVQSCYERSFTTLGSTVNWTDTDTAINSLYSGDQSADVVFYNWNRVFQIYCDGSGHQGYLDKPLSINERNLYFHGYNNTMTSLSWVLNHFQNNTMSAFMLYGFSAGGLSVFTWIETLKKIVL